ncbi:uncharacterized protein [Atheta coriaria]|uniref:uncharacterized protein n=1 Tax=Dalotia coriaria TaxID=877792 RepID=UPI0031F3B0B4
MCENQPWCYYDEEFEIRHFTEKIRGRPDDPKNKAIAAAKSSLAKTITVNPLSPFAQIPEPSELEAAKSRQHYNEFKKSYQLRHSALSLRTPSTKFRMPIIRESQHCEMYKLSTPTPSLKLVEKKSISQRPNTQDKLVNVPSWTQDSEAEYNRYTDDAQAMMLLEKLKQLEINYTQSQNSKISQFSQHSQESQNAGTQSVLEQAEKEAEVGQEQLDTIRKLLQVDKSTSKPGVSLPFIEEEEEEQKEDHPKLKQKKLVENVKEKISKCKKKNMVITLNTLNQRIQKMHEKYFNEPRVQYKSLKDIEKRLKLEKSIEVLYANEGFDPDKEISQILLENTPEKQDSNISLNSDLESKTKSVNIIRKAMSIPLERHEFTTDVSSDNYLLNKKIKNVHFHGDEIIEPESDSDLDILTSRNETENTVKSNDTNCTTKYQSAKVDVLLSPQPSAESTSSKSASTLHSIQDSILKSEYLMKEFDLSSGDLTTGLSNYATSMSTSKKSSDSLAGLPSLQRFFSATSRGNSRNNMQDAFMEDSIRTQLKNSLYDIF